MLKPKDDTGKPLKGNRERRGSMNIISLPASQPSDSHLLILHTVLDAIYRAFLVLVVKNPPANAGDVGSTPGWERSPGGGNGNPLQYPCRGNPMNRGAWWATAHWVTKSQTSQSD